jgi:hypothetical protein
MAKRILVLTILLLFASAACAQDARPPLSLTPRSDVQFSSVPEPPPAATLTVPKDTEAAVTMLSGLHTRINQVDDPVTARLQLAVYVNGQVAFPSGSLLNGRVTRVQLAGRMHRPAEIGLRFESITLPDGETEPISAVLASLDNPGLQKARLDPEGYLKGTRGFSLRGLVVGAGALGVFGVGKAALAASSAVGTLVPVGGAAVLGYAALWPRGNDVNVPPDTKCRIRLNYPVTVRVAW